MLAYLGLVNLILAGNIILALTAIFIFFSSQG